MIAFKKITIRQRYGYITGCLLDQPYFKRHFQKTAIYLSKQQALNPNPKVTQQLNFTRNLDQPKNTTMVIIEEVKETILNYSQETVRVL